MPALPKRRLDNLENSVLLSGSGFAPVGQTKALRCKACCTPLGIDHLAGIDGGDGTHHARVAGFAFDLHLAGDGAIGGKVLVVGKGEAAAAAAARQFTARSVRPAEPLRDGGNHVASARIMPKRAPASPG